MVERTKTFVIDTSFAEGHKFLYHVHNVGCIEDALNGLMIYHNLVKLEKSKRRRRNSQCV